MSLLTDEELKDGNKKLEGLVILFWVAAAISGVVFLFANLNFSMIIFGVFVAELIGIRLRKPFAIPLGRAALIITMVIFFPVGTIFGAILWPRINDPVVKKVLNYEENIIKAEAVHSN
jgi:cytochrome b subunit of formate dehydrogenase